MRDPVVMYPPSTKERKLEASDFRKPKQSLKSIASRDYYLLKTIASPTKSCIWPLDVDLQEMNADAKRCFLLKVHKRENFFGSDFEFYNYGFANHKKEKNHITFFWNFFFHWTNIREATIIPRLLSIRGKRFFLQVEWKFFSPKISNVTPFNFVKIVFQNLFHLKVPGVVFSP